MTAFPDAPLDVQSELLLNHTWVNVSPYQDHGPVSISRGHPDESTTVSPSTKAITWTNNDARFSSKNPVSPYYPYLVRNTQCRVSIPAQANYLRLESSHARAFVSDTTALHLTGSMEMRIQLTLTDWQGGSLANKWDSGGCWSWMLNHDRTLTWWWVDGSIVTHTAQSTAAIPLTGSEFALRVTFDASTGTATFYTSTTIDGTYAQLGAAVSGTGGAATTVNSSTGSALQVGDSFNFTPGQAYGRVAEYRLYNGIAGTVVADGVFSGQAAGTTTWTDSAGRTWQLASGAEISSRDYRMHAEVPEWPQHQDPTGHTWTVSAAGGGLLRRLSQRNNALNSAMWRAWVKTGTDLAAYHPLEDGAGAQSLASGIGGPAAAFSGVLQLASNSDFLCSAPLPVLNGTVITARVPAFAGGWQGNQVSWLMEVPAGGEFNGAEVMRVATNGTVAQVVVTYGTGGALTVTGYSATGTQLFTGGGAGYAVNGQALLCWLSLAPDGSGGINWELATVLPGAPNALATTGNIGSATVGAVISWTLNGGGQLLQTVPGHVAVQAVAGDLTALGGPLNAWQSEAAGRRFQRLCGEEGIEFRAGGDLDVTTLMGAQSQQTLTALLQECADADRGVWRELRQVLGWGYTPRSALYNQAAAVAVTYAQDMLGEWSTDPLEDDQVIRNDETVSQATGGTSARQYAAPGQAVSGGRLSTLPPSSGAGTYDGSDSVNVYYASDLPSLASWIVHAGTTDEPRYPGVVLDLANRGLASLFYQILGLELGQRLTIASPPAQLGPDTISLLAAQLQEELWGDTLVITMAGVPSSPYHVAQEGASTGRADADGCTLAISASSGTSVLTVAPGSRPWTASGGDLPFDIAVGGERMTVTAVAAAGSPSTRFGAWLDASALGGSDWNSAVTAWNALMTAAGTSIPLHAGRWYAGTTYTIGTTLSQMISAGVRILIDFAPPFAPVSSSDRTSIVSMLTTMLGSGADVRVSLWHEPNLGGLTNSQYTAMVQYYGPAIRALGIQVWAVFSGSDAIEANGYYPGDGFVDGIAADCYSTGTGNLENCAAMADAHNLPVGLWEFNCAFDLGIAPSPVSSVTQLQGQQFLQYVLAFFQNRAAFRQPCGDVLLFAGSGASTGTTNFLGTWASDPAGFESTIAHWVNTGNCAIARTTAQAHSGTASLSLTSSAAGNMSARPENIATSTTYALPVTPGQQVAASAWFRAAASARNVHVDVTWYDSGHVNLSTTSGTVVADTTSGWTFASFTGAAPASSAFAVAHVQVDSTAAGAEVHYVDDVQICVLPASTDHTAPVQFPWDWRIPYLQAIQAALDATGYPWQALTVTRSVNSVVKAQSSGTAVALWDTPVAPL